MIRLSLVAAIAATACIATSASATTTINFDEYAKVGGKTSHGAYPTSGDFTFSTTDVNGLASWGLDDVRNADSRGATFMGAGAGRASFNAYRTDREYFRIQSIDIGDVQNLGLENTITFFFEGVDGVSDSMEFTLDNLVGLQRINLGRDVKYFSFSGGPSGVQFDNLRYDAVGVSAVPEPATWAMMIFGFGAVGAMVRTTRRRSLGLAA
jgi:hypothetical protein